MTQPFVGQVQPFSFGFAPRYWAQCNGQTLAITQNQALFALIGTTYGGNGISTFQLPNLQSRVPMHYGTSTVGNSYVLGEQAGEEQVQLNYSNLPIHNHTFAGSSSTGGQTSPTAGVSLAKVGANASAYYAPDTTTQPLNPTSLSMAGGNLPHTNLQPYLAINWCIAMYGIYPSRG